MTQGDIDKAWSDRVASIATSTLNAALLVRDADCDRVQAIIAEEILVRLTIGDRPDPSNWKYQSNPATP